MLTCYHMQCTHINIRMFVNYEGLTFDLLSVCRLSEYRGHSGGSVSDRDFESLDHHS